MGAEGFVNLVIRKVHTCCSMKCLTKIFNLSVTLAPEVFGESFDPNSCLIHCCGVFLIQIWWPQ
ncbi:hypothetical protein HanXRQr2_Chr10g0445901 [Helianthus annuus]|uniref:Uncharacterized protein n=1 Tax=Helianthus annuus TaxID=4232 RepID=A0A251TLL5_HELAN|nr:hypothetical protein HanXRQr2_Chr10g0445901 [Helianthus annuus]KAJ0884165.1 hypothetical protein HanPSC8_Chr10g0430241 [Helianthus annuus]